MNGKWLTPRDFYALFWKSNKFDFAKSGAELLRNKQSQFIMKKKNFEDIKEGQIG